MSAQSSLLALPLTEAERVALVLIRPPETFGASSDAAKAMSKLGQTATVLLRPLPGAKTGDHQYEVIDGARRVTEALQRGDSTILAIIVETDDYHASLSTLGMNLSANDNHVGQAQAMRRALTSKTLEQVAYDSGIRLNRLKPVAQLAELPDDVLALSGVRVAPTMLVKVSKLPDRQKLKAIAMMRALEGKAKFGEPELAKCKQVQGLDFTLGISSAINSTQGVAFDPLDTTTAQVRSMAKAQGVSLKELAQRLMESEA